MTRRLSDFTRHPNDFPERNPAMPETVDLSLPKLSPAQQETIAHASDAFGLCLKCVCPACRRARTCRGFFEGPIPFCAPALAANLGIAFRAVGALVPTRAQPATDMADEVDRQIWSMTQRAAALMERWLDAMERKAGVK
jgi:hypothetical protein